MACRASMLLLSISIITLSTIANAQSFPRIVQHDGGHLLQTDVSPGIRSLPGDPPAIESSGTVSPLPNFGGATANVAPRLPQTQFGNLAAGNRNVGPPNSFGLHPFAPAPDRFANAPAPHAGFPRSMPARCPCRQAGGFGHGECNGGSCSINGSPCSCSGTSAATPAHYQQMPWRAEDPCAGGTCPAVGHSFVGYPSGFGW